MLSELIIPVKFKRGVCVCVCVCVLVYERERDRYIYISAAQNT